MVLQQFAVEETVLTVTSGHSPEEEFNWMKLLLASSVLKELQKHANLWVNEAVPLIPLWLCTS